MRPSEPATPAPQSSPPAPHQRLGEVLMGLGLVDQAGLERALRVQAEHGERLGAILTKLGVISEADGARALSIQLAVPLIGRDDYPEQPLLVGRVSPQFLKDSRVVPVADRDDGLVLAMADPCDRYAVQAMELLAEKPVLLRIGTESDIETVIRALYLDRGDALEEMLGDAPQGGEDTRDDVERLRDMASEAPIIRLVNGIMARALESHASDIHIEPYDNTLAVRYRVDGLLREVDAPPPRLAAAVVSRIKIMAKLNIAERRLPQDGRIRTRMNGRDVDMRVSTVPTLHGESVVMRLLEQGSVALDFDALGFDPAVRERLLATLAHRHGVLLVTGPTGSGKTTTLYTALKHLIAPERKIITVEDPVEYQLAGITQIQVSPDIGLGFANVLRSIVRQDPDVIMIGEMRDLETAEIAVQSALTGHMVLSTLHTNDAAGAIARMLDMGVEDYLLTSTVNAALGQRLVRTLCPSCREPYTPPPELEARMGLARFTGGGEVRLYRGRGCEACKGVGYSGRIGIYELLEMDEAMRDQVLKRADASRFHGVAVAGGMTTMLEDGIRKALAGLTTLEEVRRVTRVH